MIAIGLLVDFYVGLCNYIASVDLPFEGGDFVGWYADPETVSELFDEARSLDDIESVHDQTEAGLNEATRAGETFEATGGINGQLSESMADVATATDQQARSSGELAMAADGANRKTEMILDEVEGIDDSNRELLDLLELSVDEPLDG